MIKKLIVGASVCCMVSFFAVFGCAGLTAQAQTVSAGEIVMEVESGRVLSETKADLRLPMASTTKILTALIVAEDCPLDDVVTVPERCAGVEGSSIYLVAGEKITVKDLLYGLMLRSGNDCAETLALYHSGSIEKFAEIMNERAKAMGARDSHFTNPHGLPDEDHYTTARDLGKIACRAMKNPVFREIVSTKTHVIPDGGCGYARRLENKNKMLYNYEGANGVKTGFTKAAGRCLVSAACRNGMQLVCVVLDSPSMYERSAELLDGAFSEYAYEKVFDAQESVYAAPSEIQGKVCKMACRNDFYYPLAEGERERVRVEAEYPSEIKLPVYSGEEMGILRIYLENQLIFSQKIYSINTVKRSWQDILRQIAERFAGREGICGSTNILPNAALPAGAPAIS